MTGVPAGGWIGEGSLLKNEERKYDVVALRDSQVARGQLARLSDGDSLHLASAGGARALLIAGRPLGEPIVQYGPFVMNSRAEIEQALDDYRSGRFG